MPIIRSMLTALALMLFSAQVFAQQNSGYTDNDTVKSVHDNVKDGLNDIGSKEDDMTKQGASGDSRADDIKDAGEDAVKKSASWLTGIR